MSKRLDLNNPGSWDVSRETLERLDIYVRLLEQWNPKINLIGKSTLGEIWRRHIRDSLQLAPFIPPNTSFVADIGSGAGLPGLVLAIAGSAPIQLIESDKRKASFLRQAKAQLGLSQVIICTERVETLEIKPDIVVARAFAPIPKLLSLTQKMLTPKTRYLLLKGANVQSELTAATQAWHMDVHVSPSEIDADGSIVELQKVAPRYE